MRDKQQGGALCLELANALVALVLEVSVAYGQCFINDEDVGLDSSGCGKCQTHQHATGINAHRLMQCIANFSKGHDVVHAPVNVLQTKALQLTCHAHIFIACKFRMKAHA